ncbi:ankyrin repeat-containing domain protein [Geopyxis carbonaria]|nr:ankyrin repeat-containing domain protein [Geopyxis carbonaria]
MYLPRPPPPSPHPPIDPRLRLRRSILLDDLLIVRRILRTNPHLLPNPDSLGNTSLHLASAHNRLQVASHLLLSTPHEASGPSLNALGETPLHLAARAGHLGITQLLLSAAPGTRAAWTEARTREHETPLMLAAAAGHDGVVRALLAAGADVEAVDRNGDGALHRASAWGRLKVLRSLVEAGAAEAVNRCGWGARSYACTVEVEPYFDSLVGERERRGWGERDREMAAAMHRAAGGGGGARVRASSGS